jgi:hypothetical protein
MATTRRFPDEYEVMELLPSRVEMKELTPDVGSVIAYANYIERAIGDQNLMHVVRAMTQTYSHGRFALEASHHILDELVVNVMDTYDLDSSRAVNLVYQDYYEAIMDEILTTRNGDFTEAVMDAITNNSDAFVCLYEVDAPRIRSEIASREGLMEIRDWLGIEEYVPLTKFHSLVGETGMLYAAFLATDIVALTNLSRDGKDILVLQNPIIAIIEDDGKGDHVVLPGVQLRIPLEFWRISVNLARPSAYKPLLSRVGRVDWCAFTSAGFTKAEGVYQELYERNDKCTFGDYNKHRHDNLFTVGENPPSTHCRDCGTFWVDS